MLVHSRWIENQEKHINFGMFLGDDSLFGCTNQVTTKNLRSDIA